MATNTNERELELLEEINDFLAILDTEGGDPNEHALKLQKLRDEMNNMGARKWLNGLLETININLKQIGMCKRELTAGYLTMSTAGDCMVRCAKKLRTLPGQLLYFKTDTTVQKTQAVSQYALDELHLSNEPNLCYDLLSEIRDLILRCARLHTELFLTGKEYDQLLDNVHLLNTSIPLFPDVKYDLRELDFSQIFAIIKSKPVVPILGSIGALLGSFTFGGSLLKYIKCIQCCQPIGHALLNKGCAGCLLKCGCTLTGSVVGNVLIVLAILLAEYVWIKGFERRKVFEKIHQFRKKLGNHKIRAHLQTMCDKLETEINTLQSYFRDNSNGEIDLLDLNVIMKAYKAYRVTFEEARADTDNNDKSDEELHRLIRFGAYNCIKPLMERFDGMSKGDAWELLDGIHLMVTRE